MEINMQEVQGNYLKLNYQLLAKLGSTTAIILADLCNQSDYWQDKINSEWFFCTADNTINRINMSRKTQYRAYKELEGLGLISTKLEGLPPKKYFKINYVAINNFIGDMDEIVTKPTPFVTNFVTNEIAPEMPSFWSDTLKESVFRWIRHKEAQGFKFNNITRESLYNIIDVNVNKYTEREVIMLVETCISSNYKQIYFDRLDNNKSKADNTQKLTPMQELALELKAKYNK